MSGVGRSGPHESAGRAQARRGGGWAQLGRRGGADAEPVTTSPTAAAPESELRPVALRAPEPVVEEHHLGERLSAFVDGELGHDSRDRVQAHLATCPQCLAEADEGRAVKHLLTHTGTPAPSGTLMARLLAVGALGDRPDDADTTAAGRARDDDSDDHPRSGSGGPGGGTPAAVTGTLGGSRLTGGSFGRGAGSSFGAGALGADAPLPGVDPRAFGRGSVLRPLMGRRGPQAGSGAPLATQGQDVSGGPAADAPEPVVRTAPRARRFVFAAAAAGAFSVAAVTLGGIGGPSVPSGGDRFGSSVTPPHGPADGSAQVPAVSGRIPVDFPGIPVAATRTAAVPGTNSGRLPYAGSPYTASPYGGLPSAGPPYPDNAYGDGFGGGPSAGR
ncbi:zf-HC2 domain-containing protein [Kitasatospora sp. NBC_00315]|uniref:zf-HC2 domain-containing protein n=1 Tax=Kitasatospora sp. NBC_00315 TaxID=2975963 RepID=UPI00324C4167